VLLCLLLAGCWQTKTRPYRNVMSVQPFAGGVVATTDRNGRVVHYSLHKIDRGRYLVTEMGRGQDFGQGFEAGLFPLPGAPSNVLVLQMAALNFHAGDANLRYYGLLVVTGPNTAQEIDPDCGKDAHAAHLSAHYPDSACVFANRDSLEKVLLALWNSGRKPDTSLSLEPAIGLPK
jgi:hypothetical protein